METRLRTRLGLKITLFIAVLVLTSFSCGNVPGSSTSDQEAPTPESMLTMVPADGSVIVNGPQGVSLEIAEGTMVDPSSVQMEILDPSPLPWNETPFEPDGPQYRVLLGEGFQVGKFVMTVPLPQPQDPAGQFLYAIWVQPEQGTPSMLGAIALEGKVTFPLAGQGRYQLVKIPSSEELAKIYEDKEPLSVPSYWQMSTSWCSPTAMTNLAGYHQGAWPAGGLGSVWGESSNWYLAGLAHQPVNSGNFFHRLLGAAGYTVPEDVYRSFVNGNATVIVWNWYAFTISDFELLETPTYLWADILSSNMLYAQELFEAFHAYVEWNVWGGPGYQRPVAWGSNLADHSRTITGSDGTFMFLNDPASGSWNERIAWEQYYQETMDSLGADLTEIIGTLTLSAQPRPENERRAVLWFEQWQSDNVGSIILKQGQDGKEAAVWKWDGQGSRTFGYYFLDYGYYHENPNQLPYDENLFSKFQSVTPFDVVEYGYTIRSISLGNYNYSVQTELYNENGKVSIDLPDQSANVGTGQRLDFFPAGTFPIAGLEPGLYHLKFTLLQDAIVQDVKYVFFQMAPPILSEDLPTTSVVASPAFCRAGPGSLFPVVTGFDPGQELNLVGLNPESTWGKFEATLNTSTFQCWVSLDLMEITGEMNVPVLVPPPLPTAGPTATYCSQFTTPQTCATHTECSWDRLVGAGYCKSK